MNGPCYPTPEELRQYPWPADARRAVIPLCSAIHPLFFDRAVRLDNIGNSCGARVYWLLRDLVFMKLRPGEPHTPLIPGLVTGKHSGGRAGPEPGDLNEEALALIECLASMTDLPSLRARFSDILWICRRDGSAARHAAEDYLSSFKKVFGRLHWGIECTDELDRGMAIAAAIGQGRGSPLFSAYEEVIEAFRTSLRTTYDTFYYTRLGDILEKHRANHDQSANLARH